MKLSAEAAGGTRSESLYRRFQNFFLRFAMPLEDVGRLVLSKLPRPADGWVLSIDRTNWKYGKTHINILVVAVVINQFVTDFAEFEGVGLAHDEEHLDRFGYIGGFAIRFRQIRSVKG